MTHAEFVSDLMEYSDHGAMMQLVVMTALEKYAEQVLENRAAVLQKMRHGFVDGEAWVATVEELQHRLNARHEELSPGAIRPGGAGPLAQARRG